MGEFDHRHDESDLPMNPGTGEPHPLGGPGDRRVIRTGRTVDSINAAARAGLRPLVKVVQPNDQIYAELNLSQHPETGEIELGNHRWPGAGELILDRLRYYPYHFSSPFAAYLLPKDLAVGEEVWLEDLIEDVVAYDLISPWGGPPRLSAAPAMWNGFDFEIRYDPPFEIWVG